MFLIWMIKKLFVALFFVLIAFSNGCSSKAAIIDKPRETVRKTTSVASKDVGQNYEISASKSGIIPDNHQKTKHNYGYGKGDIYLQHYCHQNSIQQIILVEQSKEVVSKGTLFLLTRKNGQDWKEVLKCMAYLGKNGIDKKREGDLRTPTGDFGMIMAFGAKDDPGSLIPYTKLTNTMYFCGDKEYYNQFIDTSKVNHTCSSNSEHLLSYIPQYNYALVFDYNKENVYGKGSAIFLHCFGNSPYTLGCIGIAEDNMVKILRTIDTNVRICIYPGT